mmetsp:Transcript_19749/g.45466  ORF Transcript_19749/g.45466 Transcript_19749/m.45466 type:complete len:218 (+) Transcript_19749:709-1362(+)
MALMVDPCLPSSMPTCCVSTCSTSSTRRSRSTHSFSLATAAATPSSSPRTLTPNVGASSLRSMRMTFTPCVCSRRRSLSRAATTSPMSNGTSTVRVHAASKCRMSASAERALLTLARGPDMRTTQSVPLPMSRLARLSCCIRWMVEPPLPNSRPFCSESKRITISMRRCVSKSSRIVSEARPTASLGPAMIIILAGGFLTSREQPVSSCRGLGVRVR